jgi:hypothetical protein
MATGVCGGIPPPVVDAGMPAVVDAGIPQVDLVHVNDTLGPTVTGCGCASIDVLPVGVLMLLGLLRRRRS